MIPVEMAHVSTAGITDPGYSRKPLARFREME
jgi:hypothetical protein